MAISKSNLVHLAAAGVARPNLVATWQNELGSRLNITSVNGDEFAGTYDSKDAHNNWVTGTLTGTVAGDTIGFVVNWQPTYPSVTSWSGKFVVDQTTHRIFIFTLWDLATGDAALPPWQSMFAGSDYFWF